MIQTELLREIVYQVTALGEAQACFEIDGLFMPVVVSQGLVLHPAVRIVAVHPTRTGDFVVLVQGEGLSDGTQVNPVVRRRPDSRVEFVRWDVAGPS